MKEKSLNLYKKLHWLSILIGVLTVALPILFWSKIPEQLPIHYNALGEIDNWSDKSSLILLFFVVIMLIGIMSICVYCVKSGMDSKHSTISEKSSMEIAYPMLIIMNLIIQVMLAYITFCVATCRQLGIWFLPVFLAGIFVPIIVMVYKSAKLQTPNKVENARYAEIEKARPGVVYRSRVDWWLGGILIGTEVMMLWMSIVPVLQGEKPDWFIIGTTVFTSVFILPLFAIKYVMYDGHLLISMSIYGKVRVRYENIQKMEKTWNPLSSAALSLRRLQIDYMENGVRQMILISPKDRDGFMKEIEKRKK